MTARKQKRSSMKFWLSGLALASQVLLLPSCTDREIAIGVGAVVGGVVGGIVGGGSSGRGSNCRYERVRHCYRDYYGNRQCEYQRQRRCGRRYRHYSPLEQTLSAHLDSQSARVASSVTPEDVSSLPTLDTVSAEALAKDFRLSTEKAEGFLSAMRQAKNGDLEPVKALGLSRRDLEILAELRMPARVVIDRLAKNLDQDPLFTRGLLARMILQGHKLRDAECAKLKSEGRSDFGSYRQYCVNAV